MSRICIPWLKYYKLQKTFEGSIELEKKPTGFEPSTKKGAQGQKKKEPLDEVIARINERYKGDFTEADKVILQSLHDKLMANDKLKERARNSQPQVFIEGIFPKAFDDAAMDSYNESQDAFNSLFADKAKFKAFMSSLAGLVYQELRQ